jgi:hypothetical protein
MNSPKKTIMEAFPKTAKRTYGDITEIRMRLAFILNPDQEEESDFTTEEVKEKRPKAKPQKDLLQKCIDIFLFRNKASFERYDQDIDLLRAKHAVKQKSSGALVMDKDNPQNYQFTADGKATFWKEINDKFSKKEIELIPVLCEDLTRVNDLDESTKIILNGLVFKTEVMDI